LIKDSHCGNPIPRGRKHADYCQRGLAFRLRRLTDTADLKDTSDLKAAYFVDGAEIASESLEPTYLIGLPCAVATIAAVIGHTSLEL
jgi:hypothetical protein